MADEKISVLAKLKAKQGMEQKVRELALALVAPTRAEAGCISYDFHQNCDDKSLFVFYENWQSRKALDRHIQTPHLQAFVGRVEPLLAEPLDVSIWKKLT